MSEYYRLSQSPIWDKERNYYNDLGLDAWTKVTTPFYATSNGFIADNYAQIIAAYIADIQQQKDSFAKINILDIGAGHGRFSYLLLRALERYFPDEATKPYRYIMADTSGNSINTWNNHAKLQPFFDKGALDYAYFDIVNQHESRLERSGLSLSATIQQRPTVLITNFMLDVLPYDLFRAQKGKLQECKVAFQLAESALTESDNTADLFKDIQFNQEFSEISPNYYQRYSLQRLLTEYQANLDDSLFQIPLSVLKVHDYFSSLQPQHLWLIAEEADTELSQLEGKTDIGLVEQGGLTSRVNLHALKRYIDPNSNSFLSPASADPRFDCYALLTKTDTYYYPETRRTFSLQQETFTPRSYFRFVVSLRRSKAELNTDGLISLLEMSGYDPYIVRRFSEQLLDASENARGIKRDLLSQAMKKVWDNFYDIGEDFKYSYYIGRILLNLGAALDAIHVFKKALSARNGDEHKVCYRLGQCFALLNKTSAAQQLFNTALKVEPDYPAATRALKRLEKVIEEQRAARRIEQTNTLVVQKITAQEDTGQSTSSDSEATAEIDQPTETKKQTPQEPPAVDNQPNSELPVKLSEASVSTEEVKLTIDDNRDKPQSTTKLTVVYDANEQSASSIDAEASANVTDISSLETDHLDADVAEQNTLERHVETLQQPKTVTKLPTVSDDESAEAKQQRLAEGEELIKSIEQAELEAKRKNSVFSFLYVKPQRR